MPLNWGFTLDSALFQSAPDREVGRCLARPIRSYPVDGFNPRPTVRSGDAHARRSAGAIRKRFNPRPTVRSGDAHSRCWLAQARWVSIRARP